jgi:uncharacterized repeat protein (TIGR01451 family)
MKKHTLITLILLIGMALGISGCYSCKSYNEMMGKGPVDPEAKDKFFWEKECKPVVEEKEPVQEQPAPKASKCGVSEAMQAYPSEGCGVIKIDKDLPQMVQLNETFQYKMKVKNLASSNVAEVKVTEHMGDNFDYQSSTPEGMTSGGNLTWNLGMLEPGEVKEITIVGSATTTDCIENCTTIDYVIPVCTYVQVVQPKLELTKEAPEKVTICEDIPLQFTVTNNGTGTAEKVMITDDLPEGLMTLDGKDQIQIEVGSLMPGKSQLYTVNTKAESTGTYENKAYAEGAGGLEAESAMTTTQVTQPMLEITKEGPDMRYLGRSVEYTITITNTGDEVARNTVIEDTIPMAVSDVSVSDGGSVSGNKAMWQIGNLEPEASRSVTISYTPTEKGEVSNRSTVTAICAEGVAASASTEIEGIPALLLEVIDLEDPIEIGSNVTYKIIVTNQGSAVATSVNVEAMLEDTMEYVSSSGATNGSMQGDTVSFSPLGSLAPKAQAVWNVTVKATGEGDVRFSVNMNCDQLKRDVEETESTNFYE